VTTDAGSASEVVVDGVTGLVVGKSPGAVAEGVATLAADAGLRSAMGAAARERALVEFSPERMYAEHRAAYEQALASRT
jgi:glycosyltransferase involved in cell wall biosynthesis